MWNEQSCAEGVGKALIQFSCSVLFVCRPAVVDEDYREPYNIWRETLGRRDKRETHEQNEYNGTVNTFFCL